MPHGGAEILETADNDHEGAAAAGDAGGGLLGGLADYYVPHRIDEGYGVNAEALHRLVKVLG